MINLDMRMSSHFRLKELITTSHREIDNTPPPEVIERLKHLCVALLEPIREEFGPIIISSGYRSPQLNAAIGGSKESAHMFGCAADFVPYAKRIKTANVVRWVKDSGLPFDQVIDEYGNATSNWVHIGLVRPGYNDNTPRGEALVFRSGKYSTFV